MMWLRRLGPLIPPLAAGGFLVLYPLGRLFAHSVASPAGTVTLAGYVEFLSNAALKEAFRNSVLVAGWTTIWCVAIGVPMAWLISRTDMPLGQLIRTLSVLTLASPSFLGALAWLLLLGPGAGKLNRLLVHVFGLASPPFNILSPEGIIFTLVLFHYPLVLLPVAAALANVSSDLESAARLAGATPWRAVRDVVVPLALPAILSGALLVFIESFVIFGPPAVLGMPVHFYTLPTRLLTLLNFPPRLDLAAVGSVPIVLLLVAGLVFQRLTLGAGQFTVIGGKGASVTRVKLGKWKYPALAACLMVIFLSVVLPWGTLLVSALQKVQGEPFSLANFAGADNFRYLFRQDIVARSLWNSFLLSVSGTVGAILMAMAGAWVVERLRPPAANLVTLTYQLPLAFPGVALGIALLLSFGGSPFYLGGTLVILFLAYVIRGLPTAYGYLRAALKQLDAGLEEAGRVFGGSWLRVLWETTFPLTRGTIAGAGALLFVLLFRELSTSIFLYTGGHEVTAVVIFDLAQEAQFPLMAAFSVLVAAINLILAGISMWILRADQPAFAS